MAIFQGAEIPGFYWAEGRYGVATKTAETAPGARKAGRFYWAEGRYGVATKTAETAPGARKAGLCRAPRQTFPTDNRPADRHGHHCPGPTVKLSFNLLTRRRHTCPSLPGYLAFHSALFWYWCCWVYF